MGRQNFIENACGIWGKNRYENDSLPTPPSSQAQFLSIVHWSTHTLQALLNVIRINNTCTAHKRCRTHSFLALNTVFLRGYPHRTEPNAHANLDEPPGVYRERFRPIITRRGIVSYFRPSSWVFSFSIILVPLRPRSTRGTGARPPRPSRERSRPTARPDTSRRSHRLRPTRRAGRSRWRPRLAVVRDAIVRLAADRVRRWPGRASHASSPGIPIEIESHRIAEGTRRKKIPRVIVCAGHYYYYYCNYFTLRVYGTDSRTYVPLRACTCVCARTFMYVYIYCFLSARWKPVSPRRPAAAGRVVEFSGPPMQRRGGTA